MATSRRLTAIIERDGDGYVALGPQVDVASQGDTIEEARDNLREALELSFETADVGTTVTVPVPLHRELRVGTCCQSSGSPGCRNRCSKSTDRHSGSQSPPPRPTPGH
jgi:predicted RNase H-like HicB family nuclease